MEDITDYRTLYENTKKRLDEAVSRLGDARDEIRCLNDEINELRAGLSKVETEDMILIRAKQPIERITVDFKKGGKYEQIENRANQWR